MSAKRQEIQQELFGATEIDHTGGLDSVSNASKITESLDNADELEVLDSVDNIEIIERVDNMLLVKEAGTDDNRTQIERNTEVKTEAKTELSFEQGVVRLEQIIGSLEQKDIPLENALALFREGVELVQECNRMLDRAEAQMQILLEGPDGELKLEKANL